MYVLTVDTSTSYVVAGIAEISLPDLQEHSVNVRTVAQRVIDNPRGHMELLTPNIVECLAEANLSPNQLSSVVVGVGPGPFTGLRVGMATGQAFADALSIPAHGVESTAAIAVRGFQAARESGRSVSSAWVFTDARRREWYSAKYQLVGDASAGFGDCQLETVEAPTVKKPDECVAAVADAAPVMMAKAIADAAVAGGTAESLNDQLVDSDAQPTPESLVLAALMQRGGVNKSAMRALLAEPEPLRALYLRRPDAIEPKRKPISSALDFGTVERDGKEADEQAAGESEPRVITLDVTAAPVIAQMEIDLFAGDSPWPLQSIQQELTADNVTFFGLVRDTSEGKELMGYLALAKNGPADDPEWEIHTVALAAEHQGSGLAHHLIRAAIHEVDSLGGAVFLEVRTDNDPAVGLYERYGFFITGTRKGYYQPSGADAFTMMRPALGSDITAEHFAPQKAPQRYQANEQSPAGMVILGVESSCDETGVGIVEMTTGTTAPHVRMISNRVASSMEQHARFGGVVPEIASRAHLESMGPTMREALRDLRKDRASRGLPTSSSDKPDAVAATIGPGLAGALLVGAAAAKAYAAAWEVPFYGVNHLGGHVAVDLLDVTSSAHSEEAQQPEGLDNAIALLVSGGHTQILHVEGVGKPMKEMGSTLDDAAGEAYDKVARLLGLGYPGGPVIDKLAHRGNPKAIAFPRGMMRQQDSRYDFSFSGLKTAVARHVEKAEREGVSLPVEDVCASFQEAVCDVLTVKAVRAAKDVGATAMLLGGGVSANQRLRELLKQRCESAGIQLHIPPFALCTDNGVMIAALAAQLIAEGAEPSALTVGADPGLEVEVPLV